jgi:hypothetical protein
MSERNGQTDSYTPNHIPPRDRWFYGLLAAALLLYGGYGVFVDDLYIPVKRGPGLHFHGLTAWLTYAAMICAALGMISVIVDHFDTRNNETNYRLFTKLMTWGGWGLLIAGSLLWLVEQE